MEKKPRNPNCAKNLPPHDTEWSKKVIKSYLLKKSYTHEQADAKIEMWYS